LLLDKTDVDTSCFGLPILHCVKPCFPATRCTLLSSYAFLTHLSSHCAGIVALISWGFFLESLRTIFFSPSIHCTFSHRNEILLCFVSKMTQKLEGILDKNVVQSMQNILYWKPLLLFHCLSRFFLNSQLLWLAICCSCAF